MARRKKPAGVDPAYLAKQKASLRRCFRKCVNFNSHEIAMIDEYCARFGAKSRSALIRQATMDLVMKELEQSQPTLF